MKQLEADVLLLAAGFGKRLLPLTQSKPKPLIEVCGKALIDYAIDMACRAGAKRLIINVHYFPEQIQAHVGDGSSRGIEVVYSYEPEILDTGGAIKNVEQYLRHDVLLTVNSDSLFGPDFSLTDVFDRHRESSEKAEITAVLRHDPDSVKYGEIGIDRDGFVTSFLTNPFRKEAEVERLMFAGIQAISRRVIEDMPPRGSSFSVTRDTWQKLLREGRFIGSVRYNGYWNDVGTPERLALASKDVPTVFSPS